MTERAQELGKDERLRIFVEEAPVPIAMFDREMRYLAASRCWLDSLTCSERDVIGRSHYEVAPAFPERLRKIHNRALAGNTLKEQGCVPGPGGSTQKVTWEIRPWRHPGGEIGGTFVFAEGVTCRIAEGVACRVEVEQALDESNTRLAGEASALARLNEASERLWRTRSLRAGLDEMLAATIELLGADMGDIQLLDPEQNVLRFAAQRGFKSDFLEFFSEVSADDGCSCGRALRSGKPVVVEDVELDAPFMPYLSAVRAAGFRAVVSAPMTGRRGPTLGMISVYFRSPHRPTSEDLRRLDLYTRRASAFIERCEAEQALHESEERLQLALDASGMAIWDWDLQTGKVKWSDELHKLFGYAVGEVEPSYPAWAARVHPDDLITAVAEVTSAKEKQQDFVHSYRLLHADGTVRWCSSRGRSITNADGAPVRMIGLSEDVTDRRQSEETQKVLIAELQHRTRNMIAVVQSIAKQTMKTTQSPETFIVQFNARLAALSRVQGLLSRADREPIAIGTLVDMEMEALGAVDRDRITLAGPQVLLPNRTVEMLALAIHELATNASKYGALAGARGRLSVTWGIEDAEQEGRLQLEWLEQGVELPTGFDPARRGYGRTLIEKALPYSLSARTKFELADDTVRCSISLPLAETGKKAMVA